MPSLSSFAKETTDETAVIRLWGMTEKRGEGALTCLIRKLLLYIIGFAAFLPFPFYLWLSRHIVQGKVHSQKYCLEITEILLAAVLPVHFRYLKNVRFFSLFYKRESIRLQFTNWRNFLPLFFHYKTEIFCYLKKHRFKKRLFLLCCHLWMFKEVFIIWYIYFRNNFWLILKVNQKTRLFRVEYLNHWDSRRFPEDEFEMKLGIFIK